MAHRVPRSAFFPALFALGIAASSPPADGEIARGRFGPVDIAPAFTESTSSRETTTIIGNVASWSVTGRDVEFEIADGARVAIRILAADLFRVRIAPDGSFVSTVSRAVVDDPWPDCPFTATESRGIVSIITDRLIVRVATTPFSISVFDSSGSLVSRDDPVRRVQWGAGFTRVYKETLAGEDYLGLGWRPNAGIRRNGARFVMKNVPTYGDPTVFYGGIPFWYGLRSGTAWAIFVDDASWGEINAGAESSSYAFFENLGGQLDYYVFYGPDLPRILDRYTQLTGRPFFPPKWALGYHQSRWSYTPQSEVVSIANEFRTRSIPCDALYLDIDYMDGGHAFTFNPATFPDPTTTIDTLHGQGFRIVANISPFLFIDDPLFSTAAANNYLLRQSDGSVHHGWHNYWYFVGGAGTGSLAWIDFSNTAAGNWWADRHDPFLAHGIDGIWNDLNEPDDLGGAWPDDVRYDFDGQPVDHNRTGNQYCLLQTENSRAILEDHDPDVRPFVLSRAAFAGIQRSSAVWSGDNSGDWGNDFTRNIPMGLGLSLCGVPWNGHDIGGFFGDPDANDAPSGELYARWMQCGVFSPFCRQHHDGWGNHDPARPYLEPWEFGATVEAICRDAIELRYRLMPYLYSLAYRAHTTGEPVQRPTVYDFQDDPGTLTRNDTDFMFGPSVLVAPVHDDGARTRNVYLPAGTTWYDWWTDTAYPGGAVATVPAPLDRVPMLAPAGAIIPMGPVMQYADATPIDEIVLRVYPSPDETRFMLFEDDGVSFAYRAGAVALTGVAGQTVSDRYLLTIEARIGSHTPHPRSFLVELHAWADPVRGVLQNGTPLSGHASLEALRNAGAGYFRDRAADIVYVRFPESGATQRIEVNALPAASNVLSLH